MAPQAVSRRGRMGLFLLHPLLEILVTGKANVGTLHQQELVQLRLVGIVALRALPGGNGRMRTFSTLHPVPQLGMAVETELVLLTDDHPPDVGSVRIMAGQALPSLEGVVACPAGYRFHQLPVAIGAERGAGFPEELLFVGSMRNVARCAVPAENRLMDVFLDEIRFRVGMTAVTDLVRTILEDRGKIGAMGVMAGGAVPLRKRFVPDFHFIRRLYLRVAGITEVPSLQ